MHEALLSAAEDAQPSLHPLISRVAVPPLPPDVLDQLGAVDEAGTSKALRIVASTPVATGRIIGD